MKDIPINRMYVCKLLRNNINNNLIIENLNLA